MNNNTQRVTVELKNGKFQLINGKSTDELNPKALILCSAAECAGWTVMGLLAKDNVKLRNLEITAWGELNTPTLKAESIYTKFMISYNVRCNNLGDQNAVSVAVRDAQEKHCGIVAMLRRIAPVDHEISIVSLE